MEKDLNYFIEKFEAIPVEKWGTKKFKHAGRCCGFGHLGCVNAAADTADGVILMRLLGGPLPAMDFFNVNDGKGEYGKLGNTPKERVISYLKSLNK